MANPWLKKNPFMSMWLSSFNAAAGAFRSQATAQARRQGASATTRATKTVVDAWLGKPPARKKRRKKR